MGAGVAVLDFDRDGRPDLFFVNGREWDDRPNAPTQALYRNKGDGTFEDVTRACGLDVVLFGMGVAVGDVDNDGWPDLFVTAVGGNRLFRNAGGRRFEDATARAGFAPSPNSFPASAAFLDYDGDGRLDLFVCNYLAWSPRADAAVPAVLPGGVRAYVPPQQFPGAHCELWRNLDGTRFEDVSARAGLHTAEKGKALGVVVCDPDGDGWPDVAVANDTVRNFFFHNRPGPTGTRVFEETGLFAGIAYADGRPRGGMGIDAAELLPDFPAVVVANFTNEPNSLFRLFARSPVRFGDVAAEVGLAGASRHGMKFGAVFFDADRDGRPDLFTANGHLEPDITLAQPGQSHPQPGQLFWNTGNPAALFAEVGGEPFPPMIGRGCAYLDYDGDGKLDVVVTANGGRARLFRNETPDPHRSVRFRLTGTGRATNRDALGAELTLHAGGVVQRRYVTAAHGYLSQCEPDPFFGLGAATTIERVTARWPGSGAVQEWTNLAAGKTHHLTEGEAAAK
jgi:hypothetical protein